MEKLSVEYRQTALKYNLITNAALDDNMGTGFGYFPKSEYDSLKSWINDQKIKYNKDVEQLLKELKQNCKELLLSVDEILMMNNYDDVSYKRLNWIKAQTNSIIGHINNHINNEKISFDKESKMLYDVIVSKDYYNANIINDLLCKLDFILPQKTTLTLFERYTKFRNQFIIDDNLYEIVFDEMLKDAQNITKNYIRSIHGDSIKKEYYEDANDSAEAYCSYQSNLQSIMRMNKLRRITFEKCQQLTGHEGIHHIQFCLLDEIHKKYPEFHCSISLSPIDFLLEGGAELAVDLIFPKTFRIMHLKKILIMVNKRELCDKVELLLDIDEIVTQLWRLYTKIAKDMIDGHISMETANDLMQNKGMKIRESWPNVDFYKEYTSYMIGYGFGKELIKLYLEKKTNVKFETIDENEENRKVLWKAYEQFFTFPPTPLQMIQYMSIKSKL